MKKNDGESRYPASNPETVLEQLKLNVMKDLSEFGTWVVGLWNRKIEKMVDKEMQEPFSIVRQFSSSGSYTLNQEDMVGFKAWTSSGNATITINNVLPTPITTLPLNMPYGYIHDVQVELSGSNVVFVQFYNEKVGRMQ